MIARPVVLSRWTEGPLRVPSSPTPGWSRSSRYRLARRGSRAMSVSVERAPVVGEVEQRQARAVRHDDVVIFLDAILLGQNHLAQAVPAAHPVAKCAAARGETCAATAGVTCATASTTCGPMSAYSDVVGEALARRAARDRRVARRRPRECARPSCRASRRTSRDSSTPASCRGRRG